MSASPIVAALACDFTHTTAAPDVVLTFASGVSPVNVTLATGVYRMALASAAGDYLRALETAIKAAIVAARGGVVAVVVAIATTGVVTISVGASSGTPTDATFAASVWQRLGLASASPALIAGVVMGVRPVWHLVTLISSKSNDWNQREILASSETISGLGYGVTSGVVTWTDELTFEFVPRDPSFVTSLGAAQTPWEPAPGALGTLGTLGARLYSVSDFLRNAFCRTCAFAKSFPALLGDTSMSFDLVTIPGKECATPRATKLVSEWDAYRVWTVQMIRQSDAPTGTRA